MSKPQTINLNKKQMKDVERIFVGSKKVKPVTNARTIAAMINAPHRQVMAWLEERGFKKYSVSSYS